MNQPLATILQFCLDAQALAGELEASQRAIVLATIAMAMHASGQSGRETVNQALSFDLDAELVAEAVSRVNQTLATPPPRRGK